MRTFVFLQSGKFHVQLKLREYCQQNRAQRGVPYLGGSKKEICHFL